MKFIMIINVKMATIVGILTFISMINKTSENLKARKIIIFQHLSFYKQLSLVEHEISFITLRPGMVHAYLLSYCDD